MKIALIAPVSGPMARQGDLMRKGAELAIEDINAAGGIKALGGAKLLLMVEDAGDKVETAKNAAQRLVANRAGVVAGTGAWSSSLTLAVTEVTERAELPWLTLSYADQITSRGFKYVVQTVPVASQLALSSMPTVLDMAQAASGKRPTKVAIISDSTAASQAFVTPLRDGGFQKLGVTVVSDDVFTPPLTDATAMIQKLRATRPDFLLFYSTSFPDAKLVLNKMNEFGLGKGKLPAVTVGVQLASPEILKAVGPELLEGLVVVAPNWPSKAQEAALPGLTRRSGEPWLGQDTISTYGDVWLIKDALERAGSTDGAKLMAALRATNRSDGPADYYLGDRLAFDHNGRRVGGAVGLVQWQAGLPYLIWPKEDAVRTPLWPKS
ncbi:ABC transporter substrate-binding protein [Xanthobacter flavus]|uniref:ABC transporter substrate-binding protein n=1 Tax=Xanthobacter flavus TaxID=281 RepID=UPI001DCFC537|nr:branched-chain amino acid transport system substrate-binding protein [Xanthobacter flavus]